VRFRTLTFFALALLGAGVSGDARAQSCGAWQNGFGAAGPDSPFLDFVEFDDGSGTALYACGTLRGVGSASTEGVLRWNGTRWSQVGSGVRDVTALAVFDDGSGARLVAGGLFRVQDGAVADGVAAWDGTAWQAVPGIRTAHVRDMIAYDDGSGPALYLTGQSWIGGAADSVSAVRFRQGAWSGATTGLHPSGNPGPLAIYDAGAGPALYVGAGPAAPALARWNGAGWSDAAPGFAPGNVLALATYASGGANALYVGGNLSGGSSGSIPGLARFDGTSISPLAAELQGSNPTVRAMTVHDFGAGPRLVVGGSFSGGGSVVSAGLASWSGSQWESLGADVLSSESSIRALASFDDGTGAALFASGDFTRIGGTDAHWAARRQHGVWRRFADGDGIAAYSVDAYDPAVAVLKSLVIGSESRLVAGGWVRAAGTTQVAGLATFDGASWQSLGAPVWLNRVQDIVQGDIGGGSRLYAGGQFQHPGTSTPVASWDGMQWTPVGALLGAVRALALHDDGSGLALYAGGTLVGGGVRSWDGTSWAPVGTGFDGGDIHGLCVHDDGTGPALYACGTFVVQGQAEFARGIARWNGTTWSPLGPGSFTTFAGADVQIGSFDDGSGPKLYVGAAMTHVNPFWSAQFASWDGTAWSPITTDGYVSAVSAFHDGVAPRLCVARWVGTSSGTRTTISERIADQWIDIGSLDGSVATLATHDADLDGVPELFLGGNFREVSDVRSVNIARFAPCGTQGVVACPGDGTGIACPCANYGASGHGCASAVHASGASLGVGGIASLTNDTLVLEAESLTGSFAIHWFSITTGGGTSVPFHDGILCMGVVTRRIGASPITGGTTSFPSSGGARLSQLSFVTNPGEVRIYQTIYRNSASFCTSGSGNATNGLRVTWSL